MTVGVRSRILDTGSGRGAAARGGCGSRGFRCRDKLLLPLRRPRPPPLLSSVADSGAVVLDFRSPSRAPDPVRRSVRGTRRSAQGGTDGGLRRSARFASCGVRRGAMGGSTTRRLRAKIVSFAQRVVRCRPRRADRRGRTRRCRAEPRNWHRLAARPAGACRGTGTGGDVRKPCASGRARTL